MDMRNRFLTLLVLIWSSSSFAALAAQTQRGAPVPPGPESYPQTAPQATGQVPSTLMLPAGTLIAVRLTETLSSDHNNAGDSFTTVLDQPLVAQGWVVARKGQTVMGLVATAQKAGRVQGVSQLGVELDELMLVDGQQVPIKTQLYQASAGTSHGRDAQAIGVTSGVGAVIGGAAGGGTGAAIGAVAGAAAGIAGVLSTRGLPTELYPETLLTFRLENPVEVYTEQSQQAFWPVTQSDYNNRGTVRRQPQGNYDSRAYPPPPPPYYYPAYPYYYYYPGYYGPYVGYYGYGYGAGVFVAPRIYYYGGHGHRH